MPDSRVVFFIVFFFGWLSVKILKCYKVEGGMRLKFMQVNRKMKARREIMKGRTNTKLAANL